MKTGRKLRGNAIRDAQSKAGKHQLVTLAAVMVTMAVVFAAIYFYSNGGGHDGYVPGDTATPAPNFSLVDTEGGSISLAHYGGSVVVLDFMGTTCEPCKTQVDNLKAVHASYATRNVRIVSIDINSLDTNNYLQNYKLERGATWSFAVDTAGAYIEYSVVSVPTVVIIDQAGHIAKRNVGVMSAPEIGAYLNQLLEG